MLKTAFGSSVTRTFSWCGEQCRCSDPDGALSGALNLGRVGLLAACLMCWSSAGRAEYRIDVGDVVEISAPGIAELQRRVSVRPDGSISIPLLGTYRVAGLTGPELEVKLKAAAATKVFRQRLPDGRESATLIDPDEVTAIVAQYRPIYVNGDVAKPGEQPFRPLMTVRQAVSLSGGYDVLHLRTENPNFLFADLKGEYQSLLITLARERTRISRLTAELEGKDTIDQSLLADVSMAPTRIAEIINIEVEHLKIDQTDHEREKAFLRSAAKKAIEQIKVLETQEEKEEQGTQADTEELRKVTELFAKGALPSPRVTDARRAVLLSSTRKLQTAAQLMQIQKQEDDLARQLERLDDQRRIKLLQELQDARVALGQFQAKLQSTAEKMKYTAVRLSIGGGSQLRPDIALIRKGEKGHEHLTADEDSELQPGDVVEITLRSE